MKRDYLRRFGIYLFLAALIAVSTLLTKSLISALILTAFEVNRSVVAAIKSGRRWLGALLWLGGGCLLAALYYFLDLFLFPHSSRAAFRGHDAAWMSLIAMIAGLIAGYSAPRDLPVKTTDA